MIRIKKSKQKTVTSDSSLAQEYLDTLSKMRNHIENAQLKTIVSANRELTKVYYYIGEIIVEKQKKSHWGTGIIERMAKDLENYFPGVSGFSRSNIFKMRAFYLAYQKVSQAVRQLEDLPIIDLPWGHNVVLITKLKNIDERLWYAYKAIEYGWSRSMLETQISLKLYRREGKAITNFQRTLPAPHSDMAQKSFKDPYIFDFLGLKKEYNERDIEQGLIENVQKLLLELGKGFCLVGRQYHLEIEGRDFYIDLLFYHLTLRCYIVIELKGREFDPRDAGQLNFYLSAVDSILRHSDDKPTIGLILCKTKNNLIAEYALRDINKPMGVAGYELKILEKLPKELKKSLPTVEELEWELNKDHVSSKKSKKKRN